MKSIPGNVVYKALKDKDMIIMACNVRIIKGVARGIFRAAKDADAAIIFEVAKSESDLKGGYLKLTPNEYSERIKEIADEVGHDIWVMHADHIGVKNGTYEEMMDIKELIMNQIEGGFTSFAIDASHLFNFEGTTVEEQLADNINSTIELANFIMDNNEDEFGLEVEVGEIGWKDENGRILTKPEEAVTFIEKLNEAGIAPDLLAIANGSAHGNTYDKDGKLIEQVSIDINQTIAVGKAIKKAGFDVKIAQHGITGTPINLIKERFPKEFIRKGNVGTHWQNIVWEVLEKEEPELFKKITQWTLAKYSKPGKSDEETFGKSSKFAIREFFDEIYNVKESTERTIEQRAYEEAMRFFDAFNANGSAAIVRKSIR